MTHTANRVGKQHLLDVAEQLFTELGYQAVSIRDIAQASGVTNAALYYHFPNKEALFREVLECHIAGLRDRMEGARDENLASRERVVNMLTEYGTLVANRQAIWNLISPKRSGRRRKGRHPIHIRLMEALLTPIEDELRIAIDSGELNPLPEGISPASLLIGMLHGFLQYRRIFLPPKPLDKEDIRSIVDVFWRGLQS